MVFDFDGTLVDSNKIKISAFASCFADYPQHLDVIMEYCSGHHHTPREVKFRHVFENILRKPFSADRKANLLKQYAQETTNKVIAAEEIEGATAFVKKIREQKRIALLSSTPHSVLLYILQERGLRDLFDMVQGAPVDKTNWLRALKGKENLENEEVLFFGDAREDYYSAQKADIPFVAIANRIREAEASFRNFKEISL